MMRSPGRQTYTSGPWLRSAGIALNARASPLGDQAGAAPAASTWLRIARAVPGTGEPGGSVASSDWSAVWVGLAAGADWLCDAAGGDGGDALSVAAGAELAVSAGLELADGLAAALVLGDALADAPGDADADASGCPLAVCVGAAGEGLAGSEAG